MGDIGHLLEKLRSLTEERDRLKERSLEDTRSLVGAGVQVSALERRIESLTEERDAAEGEARMWKAQLAALTEENEIGARRNRTMEETIAALRAQLSTQAEELAEITKQRDYYKSVHDEMLPTTRHDAKERLAQAEELERLRELLGWITAYAPGGTSMWPDVEEWRAKLLEARQLLQPPTQQGERNGR
jgi:chromosome segregation ATPase